MRFTVFLVLVFLQSASFARGGDSLSITGFWLHENKDYVIEIVRDGEVYHGSIVWLADPLDNYDKPLSDLMNKDPEKRSRPVLGLVVLEGFEFDHGAWESGKIYDHHSGQTYNGKMKIDGDGSLRVTGYYGILFFLGKTKVWSKVNDKAKYNLE